MPSPTLVDTSSTDPFERGRQRGRQVASHLERTWPVYESLFGVTARDAGQPPVDVGVVAQACLEALWAWSPDLVRELEGVAAGSGRALTTLLALNARTEVFAVAGGARVTECSTVVQMDGVDGTPTSAQTWDWHDELADGWHVQRAGGGRHAHAGLAEYGMLAKIGVNSAGLGIHFNLLRHESDVLPGPDPRPRAGVPVHLVAASILARAGTVAEAVELASSAPIAASTVITVVSPDGAACLELSPAGVAVVAPSDGWLIHTNHFLDPQLARGEAVTQNVTTTFERAALLRDRTRATTHPLAIAELVSLLCAHDDDGVAVCRHPERTAEHGYRGATLATVALDPVRREALVSQDGPCERREITRVVAAD